VQDGLDFLVLLTKADKLNRAEGQKALSIAKLQTAGGGVRLFSALKKTGVDEVSLLLQTWAQSGLPQPLPEVPESEMGVDEPPALDE
jgi:GTP-binding protein